MANERQSAPPDAPSQPLDRAVAAMRRAIANLAPGSQQPALSGELDRLIAALPRDEIAEMSLWTKLAHIAQECSYVQKRGENKGTGRGYKFATAADVLAKVNEALAKYRVGVTVHTDHVATVRVGNSDVYTARVTITLVNGDDPSQTTTTDALGSGMDTGDKGIMKAQTVALKYAWMLALNISTGEHDDPEADARTDAETARVEAERAKTGGTTADEKNAQQKSAEEFAKRARACKTGDELTVVAKDANVRLSDTDARTKFGTAYNEMRTKLGLPTPPRSA